MDPSPCSDAASPWWIGAAASIIVGLVGAVGRMWAVLLAERKAHAAERAALASAIDGRDSEHKRDLRHVIGWWSQKPPSPAELLQHHPPDPVAAPPRPRERRPKKPP